MSLFSKISAEISPFFKYATPSNYSLVAYRLLNENNQEHVRRIYQNCVTCNVQKFSKEEMSSLWAGTDTYFCTTCFYKIAEVTKKYDTGFPTKESAVFNIIWNDYLFRDRRESPSQE